MLDAFSSSISDAPDGVVCKEFSLRKPLEPGDTTTAQVMTIYIQVLKPFPSHISSPADPQLVTFDGALHLIAPYKVEKESVKVIFDGLSSNSAVKNYTKVDPVTVGQHDGTLTYGPFTTLNPYAITPLHAHFENRAAMLEATRVEREIDVSHTWSVAVREEYEIRNVGPVVQGEWSRYEYQRGPAYGEHAAREFKAVLLPGAHSLFYRDEIGNISTSAVRHSKDGGAVAALVPRFPLFGGWNIKFLFGWSMAASDALIKRPQGTSSFSLISSLGPSIRDVVVDELMIKVLLPPGSQYVETNGGKHVDVALSKEYTYADVLGRPVVVIRVQRYAPEMNGVLTVTYTYPTIAALQRPVIVILLTLLVFLIGHVTIGCDVSIVKHAGKVHGD